MRPFDAPSGESRTSVRGEPIARKNPYSCGGTEAPSRRRPCRSPPAKSWRLAGGHAIRVCSKANWWPLSLWKYGLLVKNWETAAGPLRPMTRPQNYRLLIPSEISPAPGTAGQGNPDPPSIFLNHFIVKWSGQFYDPSYGGPAYPTQEAWENGSLAGFFYIDRRVIQIHPLVIGEKRWAKLNDPTKTETRFTSVQ